MEETISLIVVTAGFLTGSIIGAILPTNFELGLRSNASNSSIFDDSSTLGLNLNEVLRLMLFASILILIPLSVLHLGNAHPLTNIDRYTFVVLFIMSVAIAKWLRFLYWRYNA
jgi:hypothetical protein